MYSTREQFLALKDRMLNLPLYILHIPANCDNETYEAKMRSLILKAQASGIQAIGFGDLFLAEVRDYREQLLAGTNIEPIFPLWGFPTSQLAFDIVNCGINAV